MKVYLKCATIDTRLVTNMSYIELDVDDDINLNGLDKLVMDRLLPGCLCRLAVEDTTYKKYMYWGQIKEWVCMDSLYGLFLRWFNSYTSGKCKYAGYEIISKDEFINRLLD